MSEPSDTVSVGRETFNQHIREFRALEERCERAEAQCAALREALEAMRKSYLGLLIEYYHSCDQRGNPRDAETDAREFYARQPEIVAGTRALSTDSGSALLAELKALREVTEAAKWLMECRIRYASAMTDLSAEDWDNRWEDAYERMKDALARLEKEAER